MLREIVKSLFLLASVAVGVPYTVALLCNVLYGWPQSREKYKRALNPKKVYALNYTVLQKLSLLRFAPLYIKWKYFYRHADKSILLKNVPFGRNDRTLDLYIPQCSDPSNLRPVVIFVYGGAWGSGDKSSYGLLCLEIATRLETIVCCPNYSLYPQGYVDDMIQDIVDSINWVFDSIQSYGGDKNQIMLIGHSAGAHLCAMAILELLHDERVQIRTAKGDGGRQLRFTEHHYNGSNNNSNDGRRDALEESSGSSESFAVVSENGEQSNLEGNNVASTFEVLNGNQEQSTKATDSSDAGITETTVKESEMGAKEGGEEDKAEEGVHGEGEEEEEEEEDDSGDDDSVVTVRPKDIERHPTLVDLCKSVKAFIGLAGVYEIEDHFIHESKRGVEDVSSMGRAMYGEDHFNRFSPTVIVKNLARSISLPQMVLVHGTDDYVVPLTSTTKFGDALSDIFADVTVRILPGCDHYDICLDLMHSERKFYDSVIGIIMETAKKSL